MASTSFQLDGFKIKEAVIQCFAAGLVPMLHSSPGIGKSSIAREVAQEFNLELIDLRLGQCDPTDLNGFGTIDKDGIARYIPFDVFPLAGTPLPKDKAGWLLLLDEITSAPKEVEAAAYKLILDRAVGQHPLNENVFIMAAGNLSSDNAIVNQMSTATKSRMVHLVMKPSLDVWLKKVAMRPDAKPYDERIVAFLYNYQNKLMDFHPDSEELTYPCPRTWEFVNRLLTNEHMPLDISTEAGKGILAGTIGESTALDFTTFVEVYDELVKDEDIRANPLQCHIPASKNVKWATVVRCMNVVSKETAEIYIPYVNRFPLEFRILALNMLMAKSKTWADVPAFVEMAVELADYIYG